MAHIRNVLWVYSVSLVGWIAYFGLYLLFDGSTWSRGCTEKAAGPWPTHGYWCKSEPQTHIVYSVLQPLCRHCRLERSQFSFGIHFLFTIQMWCLWKKRNPCGTRDIHLNLATWGQKAKEYDVFIMRFIIIVICTMSKLHNQYLGHSAIIFTVRQQGLLFFM